MHYLLSFLEGIITFISPCLLPMLPVYISYFAADTESKSKKTAVINSISFVLGFTVVFVALGAFSGILGSLLLVYSRQVYLVSGLLIILFGLSVLGIIKLPLLNIFNKSNGQGKKRGVLSSFVFGLVFSVCWTPCVGAFLGSALILAATSGNAVQGIIMLLLYSLGLGIPFIISALLLDKLKTSFDFIKRHYKVINTISGIVLIILGILIATNIISVFYSWVI